ncbi:MAG: response regulator transcription factor [Anaerolineales bacterium]
MAKILLIEAHPLMRPAIHDLLELVGHTVVEMDRGEKALHWLAENDEVDLVMTNVDLIEMNGSETLIQQVRALHAADTPPILVFTVKADPQIQAMGQNAGADVVLLPPLTADILYNAVGQLLKSSQPEQR